MTAVYLKLPLAVNGGPNSVAMLNTPKPNQTEAGFAG